MIAPDPYPFAAYSGAIAAACLAWVSIRALSTIPFRPPRSLVSLTHPLRHGWTFPFLCSVIALSIALAYRSPLLGVLPIFLGTFGWTAARYLPGFLRGQREAKRATRIREVFPQALGMATQAVKAGQTMAQAVEYLSKESPSPLREEWALVHSEVELGADIEDALLHFALRYPSLSELRSFVESYRISRGTGADLARMFHVLLDGLEEKNRLRRKKEALTAQARLSGTILGALPFFLCAVFSMLDPSFMAPLFTEARGAAILLLAVLLEGVGALWIRQILRREA